MIAEVTPYVGVWIETYDAVMYDESPESHPTWVCGLKQRDWQEKMWGMVTPYVGVWIETLELAFNADGFQGHTLRGCVD